MQTTLATLQQYEAQIKAFSAQLTLLEQVMREEGRAQTTLEGLHNTEPGQELLIPLGQGTYLHGKVTETDNALVSLGSDVTQQVSLEEALQRVGQRVKEAEQAMQSYAQSINQMQSQYTALQEKVEQALQESRAKGGGGLPGLPSTGPPG